MPLSLIVTAPFLTAVDAIVRALPATVVAPIGLLTTSIELPVDPVALPVQALCTTLAAIVGGAIRLPVEASVNAVAPGIQSVLDAIAALVKALLDPVTRISERRSV